MLAFNLTVAWTQFILKSQRTKTRQHPDAIRQIDNQSEQSSMGTELGKTNNVKQRVQKKRRREIVELILTNPTTFSATACS